jgi:hypothetical protein
MTPSGPNLSHWPGNRTPHAWKADLSTGIALNFARAAHAEQTAFLGGVEIVLNDHYDTDGFGALLAVLRPDVASAREEVLLAAAATGDFGVFQTARSFAIDRIVLGLAGERSPVRSEFAGLAGPALSLARYRWLIEHSAEVLGEPAAMATIYEPELASVQRELDAARRGALERRLHAGLGFAVLTTRSAAHRMVLNTLAGAYRVLHVDVRADGPHFRYHDRTESWFELATFRAPPRRDLRPLAVRLDTLEPAHDGACWTADAPQEPIPELFFGVPAAQAYGEVTRELRPSRLPPAVVEREIAQFFAAALDADLRQHRAPA